MKITSMQQLLLVQRTQNTVRVKQRYSDLYKNSSTDRSMQVAQN